jgi:xylulokinase
MADNVIMGIDLGTSSVKVVLMNPDGRVVGSAAQEYAFDIPRPGWAEQDPQVWVQASLAAMQRALSAAGLSKLGVQTIGLSGQMHGLVCVDEAGVPVRPAIIWADQRSTAQVERIYRQVGARQLGEWTANPVATGFLLPSWLWLTEHEPAITARTRHLLLPKDYLRYALTGCLGIEPSDASSSLLFDTAHRRWSLDLASALGIDPALLLAAHESAEVAGGLTQSVADALGLTAGLPVIYGGSDQGMAALGQGITQAGQLACSISTGGQMVAPLERWVYDPELRAHTFCHVLSERWFLEAATLSAGLALRWLRDNIFKSLSYAELANLAAQTPSSEGLFFLPHLAGERTPYMDAGSKAGFWGLTLQHHQGHMVRAVMEGVIFSMRACLDLFLSLGVPVERVVAAGGGTRHPLWMQLMADIFNRPITQTGTVEASATGAAILAGVGVGIYPDAETACRRVVHFSGDLVQPNPAAAEYYRKAYQTYTKLYPAFQQIREGSRPT